MIATFTEGIRSVAVPCSLTLVLPAAAVVLAARRRPGAALAAFAATAVATIWGRAAGVFPVALLPPWPVLIGGAGVAAMATFLARQADTAPRTAGLAAVLGALSGWIWQPCVGAALGAVLDQAGAGSPAAAAGLVAYTSGVLLPVGGLALARVALGDTDAPRRAVTVAGVGLGVAIGLLVVSGRYEGVVGWLAQLSA